jgi:tRNA G37 N-methylase TrmD
LKQAAAKGKVGFHLQNPRDFTTDPHRTVDEKPFGGGAGMVLKPEPIFKACGRRCGDYGDSTKSRSAAANVTVTNRWNASTTSSDTS